VISIAPADGLELVAGRAQLSARPLVPFAPPVLALLGALSQALRADAEARTLVDLQTFAFWCRGANLNRLKARHDDGRRRLGLGLVLHIAPGNVPVNFAYTAAFGLLAGNANLVRLPSRPMPQVTCLARVLEAVLALPEHAGIAPYLALVRYAADGPHTAALSALCAARVTWGGDRTVAEVRALPLPPRALEVSFPDRYSLCLIDAAAVVAAEPAALARLAEGFFNDTFLMDQNACSSPHLVAWLGEEVGEAQARFWGALAEVVGRRYRLEPVAAVDRYTLLLEALAALPGARVGWPGGPFYTVTLPALPQTPEQLERLRGRFGLFYQVPLSGLAELAPAIGPKVQTITCFGREPAALADAVVALGLTGVDRVVPVGQALEIGLVWDGRDLIQTLSRIVAA